MNQNASQETAGAKLGHKRLILIAIVATLIIGGLWLAVRKPDGLVQGTADADTIKVSAKITARIARLHVREGDRVKAGQILFELDSPEVQAKGRQAGALLDAARAQAAKADEGARQEEIRAAAANWKRAAAAVDLARSTFRRVENLYLEGVVTLQKRDEALAQQRSADEAAAAARAQYDLAMAGTRSQDKLAAQAQVRQAEGGMDEVEASRVEVRGLAPSAGEVNKRLADIGELVPAGYPVFTLIDLNRVWVAFYLREEQFAGLKLGQHLRGRIPALSSDGEFEVYFINPAGDFATWRATRQSAGYDIKSFEVRARPVRPIAGFRPGMSVLFAWPNH
ncbi:HlyD family secretion protein [Lysobacter gummosus]|uniref:Efflux RND transporter periplasmic adaptor subunit n=1 Tax=Lysobacter gummosus TaxID=262324 RepID=A0ABY3X9E3_9GAMM|nr:efflux RND transporter periplasmic adaptor subunit [Lysobacter gummosus]UNP29204.1 efflux RND transporter periplasmic adaptor subunit [Lysobacter gummosus]